MTIDDALKILAVIGGITGPVGLWVSVLTFRRDVGWLRVRVQRDRLICGADDDDVRYRLASIKAAAEDPPAALYLRDPDRTWTVVEVTNVGRRPVRIASIVLIHRDGGGAILNYPPQTIEETQRYDFQTDQADLDAQRPIAIGVYDTTGRAYYTAFERSWPGVMLRLRLLFRLSPPSKKRGG